MRSLLAKLRKTFQQIRDPRTVPRFPQCLDQVVQRSLVLRVLSQSLAALLDGILVAAGLQIEFRQHRSSPAQAWSQGNGLPSRAHGQLKFWMPLAITAAR